MLLQREKRERKTLHLIDTTCQDVHWHWREKNTKIAVLLLYYDCYTIARYTFARIAILLLYFGYTISILLLYLLCISLVFLQNGICVTCDTLKSKSTFISSSSHGWKGSDVKEAAGTNPLGAMLPVVCLYTYLVHLKTVLRLIRKACLITPQPNQQQ